MKINSDLKIDTYTLLHSFMCFLQTPPQGKATQNKRKKLYLNGNKQVIFLGVGVHFGHYHNGGFFDVFFEPETKCYLSPCDDTCCSMGNTDIFIFFLTFMFAEVEYLGMTPQLDSPLSPPAAKNCIFFSFLRKREILK